MLTGLYLSPRKNFKISSETKLVTLLDSHSLLFFDLDIDIGALMDLFGTLQDAEASPVFTHLTSLSEKDPITKMCRMCGVSFISYNADAKN